jgi:hypothetical protein
MLCELQSLAFSDVGAIYLKDDHERTKWKQSGDESDGG